MERVKSILLKDKHQTRRFCAFALVLILMAILVPDKFFTVRNFQSMATQFPELGFLTIAAALVLIAGGIDLSVCGTAVLSGIVAARILDSNGSSEAGLGVVILAVAVALLVGLVCGVLNAILVARFGIATHRRKHGYKQTYHSRSPCPFVRLMHETTFLSQAK